jgi:hypothetical protein
MEKKGLPEVLVVSRGGYIFGAKKCCGKCAKVMQQGNAEREYHLK